MSPWQKSHLVPCAPSFQSFRPRLVASPSLMYIILEFSSQFCASAKDEDCIQTVCIDLKFCFCGELSSVLSGQKLQFCQYSILLPLCVCVCFFSSVCQFFFWSFTSLLVTSFIKKNLDVLHLLLADTAPTLLAIAVSVCVSVGWKYRDEGLHSACLWLTWLRKTAPGFAPGGRKDCAIFMKNIPVVPASVTRRLWIKPGHGRLPRGRGREGHIKAGNGGMQRDDDDEAQIELCCVRPYVRFMVDYWCKHPGGNYSQAMWDVFNHALIFSSLHLTR